jgi:hypothetical protein
MQEQEQKRVKKYKSTINLAHKSYRPKYLPLSRNITYKETIEVSPASKQASQGAKNSNQCE